MSLALIELCYQSFPAVRHGFYNSHRIKLELWIPSTSFTSLYHSRALVETSARSQMERPAKRVRLSPDTTREDETIPDRVSSPLASLHRSITPPPRARSLTRAVSGSLCPDLNSDQLEGDKNQLVETSITSKARRLISSPIQLTHIRDFPESRGYNVDTVKLRDILGDPMIRECWQFNYLFDVDFLMSNFDEDVRSLVKVKVVHGSWERESANRVRVEVSIRPLFSECQYRSELLRV